MINWVTLYGRRAFIVCLFFSSLYSWSQISNQGHGTQALYLDQWFEQAERFVSGTQPILSQHPRHFDYDRDGQPDILIAEQSIFFFGLYPFKIYLSQGGDQFHTAYKGSIKAWAPGWYAPSQVPRPTLVEAMDLDGNGYPEIVVAYNDGEFAVYPDYTRRPTSGTDELPHQVFSQPQYLPIIRNLCGFQITYAQQKDINQDGVPELWVSLVNRGWCLPSNAAHFVLSSTDPNTQQPTPTLQEMTPIFIRPTPNLGDAKWQDVNGDGWDDLIALDRDTYARYGQPMLEGDAVVWLIEGTAQPLRFGQRFQIALNQPGVYFESLELAQMDSDPEKEILVSGKRSSTVWRIDNYLNYSPTISIVNLATKNPVDGILELRQHDLNGDRIRDLVVKYYHESLLTTWLAVYPGRATGGFQSQPVAWVDLEKPYGVPGDDTPQLSMLAFGDVNNDGWSDIIVSGMQPRNRNQEIQPVVIKNLRRQKYSIWTDGSATPGAYGEPILRAEGTALSGVQNFALIVENIPPLTPVRLIVGRWPIDQPVPNYPQGFRILAPPEVELFGSADANGVARFAMPLNYGLGFSMNDVAVQALALDFNGIYANQGVPFVHSKRLNIRVGNRQ